MNFYELFEKREDTEHQNVTIADPKAAFALKQARAKYSYADSDLEAFVKMTQDNEEEEDQEIEKIEKEIQNAENEIKDLEDTEASQQDEINRLEKENDLQDKSIRALTAKEKAYERMSQDYVRRLRMLDDHISDLENRLAKANLQGFEPATRSQTVEPEKGPEAYISPYDVRD